MRRWSAIVIVSAVLISGPAHAGRAKSCNPRRCGFRISECALARGGVDGAEIPGCRHDVVEACRHQRSRSGCAPPSFDAFAATLARVQAWEATVHDQPLCAALLPDVPATTIDEVAAIGRDVAAALAASSDPSLGVQGHGFRGGAFGKLFLQGFSGHGAAFIPLGDVIVANSRPRRAVTYATDSFSAIVHGVIGVRGGRATGLLLTYCPTP